MKETLSAILGILQEFRKDAKSSAMLVLFGLVFGLGYVIFVLIKEKNELAQTCETELSLCQSKRFEEIKETQIRLLKAISKIDSLNNQKKRR